MQFASKTSQFPKETAILKPGQILLFKEPIMNMTKPGRLKMLLKHAPNTNVNKRIVSTPKKLNKVSESVATATKNFKTAVQWTNYMIN